MERKCLKEYSVVFLVEGEKFKLRNLLLEDFIFVVGSAAHSVGTTLEFAAFRSRLTLNIAQLVPSGFFLSTTMVFAVVEYIFPGKPLACSCRYAYCHGKKKHKCPLFTLGK